MSCAILLAGLAVVVGVALQPAYGINSRGHAGIALLAGVVVGGLYECRGDASSFEWFGDNGVTDVECAIFNTVGHMGCFAVLCQDEAMLLGLVLDVHDALIFIGYI